MKTLLIGLTLFCAGAVAHAADYYDGPLNNGGKLTLTLTKTDKCNDYGGFAAYAQNKQGKTLFGCWSLVNDEIMVSYFTGQVYTYPLDMFTARTRIKPSQQSAPAPANSRDQL